MVTKEYVATHRLGVITKEQCEEWFANYSMPELAVKLGVNRYTLYYYARKFGIDYKRVYARTGTDFMDLLTDADIEKFIELYKLDMYKSKYLAKVMDLNMTQYRLLVQDLKKQGLL